jgi:2-polyprenyl-3-methyl-5-hydroxy-6-metoxy-1,4-benzoquinol methylase
MKDETATLASRYYLDLAVAFIRGRLDLPADLSPAEVFQRGQEAGLRLHKFKRSTILPRVQRVFGYFRQLWPGNLLDVGSGRGVFLWPLLDTFSDLRVHCLDIRPDRVADIQAVHTGGIERLVASVGDITGTTLPDVSFDGVTLLEVLEHLEEPGEAVREAVRLARNFVVVSVPSQPDDNPEHIHLFDARALEEMFRAAGVERLSVDYVLNHIVALAMVGRS